MHVWANEFVKKFSSAAWIAYLTQEVCIHSSLETLFLKLIIKSRLVIYSSYLVDTLAELLIDRSHIFQNGKVLPIERGQGIDQPIMRIAAKKASEGDWVHVFPEARVGYTGSIGPLKWGIGKLVCEAYREDQSDTRYHFLVMFSTNMPSR